MLALSAAATAAEFSSDTCQPLSTIRFNVSEGPSAPERQSSWSISTLSLRSVPRRPCTCKPGTCASSQGRVVGRSASSHSVPPPSVNSNSGTATKTTVSQISRVEA